MQVARVRIKKTFEGELISEEITALGDSVDAYVADLAAILAPTIYRQLQGGGVAPASGRETGAEGGGN